MKPANTKPATCPCCGSSSPITSHAHGEYVTECCAELWLEVEDSDIPDDHDLLSIKTNEVDAVKQWCDAVGFVSELIKLPIAA